MTKDGAFCCVPQAVNSRTVSVIQRIADRILFMIGLLLFFFGKLVCFYRIGVLMRDMIGCVRELMLEGKAVKLEGLAIFSAGIKTKKNGADSSADFSTTKHIDSVYMRARATGEFTRQELTKAGNVTELPKNYTDYEESGSNGNGDVVDQPSNGGGQTVPSGDVPGEGD